jgi:hypothetical protein
MHRNIDSPNLSSFRQPTNEITSPELAHRPSSKGAAIFVRRAGENAAVVVGLCPANATRTEPMFSDHDLGKVLSLGGECSHRRQEAESNRIQQLVAGS